MTKYLQIGFWISPKARGFWLNGLRRKSILKNDPQTTYFMGNWETFIFRENVYFVYAFLWFCFSSSPIPIQESSQLRGARVPLSKTITSSLENSEGGSRRSRIRTWRPWKPKEACGPNTHRQVNMVFSLCFHCAYLVHPWLLHELTSILFIKPIMK